MTNETATIETEHDLHPFERAGLGKAPFRFTGMHEKTYQACPGAPVQPGGMCSFCGQGIRYCCGIRSADGQNFIVGCDCVARIADDRNVAAVYNREIVRLATAVKDAQRLVAAGARAAKAVKVETALRADLAEPALRERLAALPHPRAFRDLTALDWCEWMLANAGAKGRAEVAKFIKGIKA